MRRGIGVLWLVLTTIFLAVVGVIAYQAGWSEGFAQHVPEAAGSTAAPIAYYPYYYGPHFFGFGWIFGLLFFLFILFLIFRIASFGRWAGRGWGGYGGRGGWKGQGGGGIPPAIDERMREWHRQAHGDQPAQPGSTPPPPPPDQRSV
jgi:hypothetical protein